MFKTSDAFLEKDTGSDVIVSAEGPKQKKRAVNSTVPETKKRTTYGHTNSTNRKKMQKKNRITHNVWVRPESFTQKHSEVYHTLKYRKKMSGCRICRSLNFLIHLQHFKRTRHHHTGRKRLKNKGVASALEQQAVPLPLFLFLFYSSITSHLAFTSRTPPSGGTGKWRSWPGISWTGHAKETATTSLLFYLIVVRAVCIFTLHFLFYVLLSVSSSS